MKSIATIVILLFSNFLFAQATLSGTVVYKKGIPSQEPISLLKGPMTAQQATILVFSFETDAKGTQTLVVSFLIFETSKTTVDVANCKGTIITLKESYNALDAVVISAGTMEAGDKAKVSVLKPLDIVTTAGSAGNIITALQTLPGTQSVGEDGRLFVRGGEANETQTFVDGLRVAQPTMQP